ncbi:unnamed protein product [Cunninghamella blakesleeana]
MMQMKKEGINHEDNNHNSVYNYKLMDHHQQQQQQQKQEEEGTNMKHHRSDQLDNLSIDDSGQLRYYGGSSGFDMLHRNKNLKNGSVHFSSRETKFNNNNNNQDVDDNKKNINDLNNNRRNSNYNDNDNNDNNNNNNNDQNNNSNINNSNSNNSNKNKTNNYNNNYNNNNNNNNNNINHIRSYDKYRLLTNINGVDPYELPPNDLSEHLLDLYFKTFYPWLPVIHKDSFLERMQSKDNKPPLLLLNAIYGVTSRLSPDLRVRSDPQQSDTAGDIFFERARLLMEMEWDDFKVYTVQALVLMSSHSNGALKTSRGWLYSGMAFRMAQNLGLHRNCENWDLTEIEKEERRRCFYCCFVVDRLSCAMHGRSPALDERDYDAVYPCYQDKDDANGEAKNIMERFRQLIKLCELLGDVLRDLYMVRGRKQLSMMTCPDSVVANLDRGLNKWMTKLPQSMQYRPPNARLAETAKPPALQLCQMHMLFYTTLILLHRPFIPGSSSTPAPSIFPSSAICTFAANKIVDISVSLLSDGRLKYVNNYALYFMFTAGTIFIHNAQSADEMFSFEAKISINKIMHAMDELEKTWSTSARHCNILGALAGLRDINLECVDESYSKSQKSAQEAAPPPLSIAVPNSPDEEEEEYDDHDEFHDANDVIEEDGDGDENEENNNNDHEDPRSSSKIESEPITSITLPTSSTMTNTISSISTNNNSNNNPFIHPSLLSSVIDEKYANYYMGLNISTSNASQLHPFANTSPTSPISLEQRSILTSLPNSSSPNSNVLNSNVLSSSPTTTTTTIPFPTSSSSSSSTSSSLLLSSSSLPPHTLNNDKLQTPFNPNNTAFWEIPSSINISEWNSYLTDQAQKIDPLMMPPIVENDETPSKYQESSSIKRS